MAAMSRGRKSSNIDRLLFWWLGKLQIKSTRGSPKASTLPSLPGMVVHAGQSEDLRKLWTLSAAKVLGSIGDPRAVSPLIAGLTDLADAVRAACAEALGQIGDRRAVMPLVDAFRGSSPDCRGAICQALGRIGDARTCSTLVAALDRLSYMAPWVIVAVRVLGDLGDPSAVPTLQPVSDYFRDRARATRFGMTQESLVERHLAARRSIGTIEARYDVVDH